jgi:acylphosphatase
MTELSAVRLTAWVEGRVQGVGFRWWVRARALELGLVGFAENLADGRVKVVAEGASGGCQDLLALLADGTASRDDTRVRDTAGSSGIAGGGDGNAGGGAGGGRGAAADLATGRGGGGGLAWPSRSRRPGRVTRVAYRWADAAGDMSGFTER